MELAKKWLAMSSSWATTSDDWMLEEFVLTTRVKCDCVSQAIVTNGENRPEVDCTAEKTDGDVSREGTKTWKEA